jgi:hypothetical protein
VGQLTVTPAYLDRLKDALTQAQKSLKAGFDAPHTVGGLPTKLYVTHGVTCLKGSAALMTVIDENRADVGTHLANVIDGLQKALDAAKKAYASSDESNANALANQMESRS